MILIQSSNGDVSTNHVIDWLLHFNKKFFRLNGENLIEDISVEDNHIEMLFRDVTGKINKIELEKVKSFWYRRGDWNIFTPKIQNGKREMIFEINHFFNMESSSLSDFINFCTQRNVTKKIGNEEDNNLNKLKVLEYAKSIELNIPDTIVTSRKKYDKKDDVSNCYCAKMHNNNCPR